MASQKQALADKRTVWVISGELRSRAYLRAELLERGFEAKGFHEIGEALAVLYHPCYPDPGLIVLELRSLPLRQDELNAVFRIGVPVIVLGGAVELNDELIKKFPWETVVRRPFTIGQVADLVEKTLRRRPAKQQNTRPK